MNAEYFPGDILLPVIFTSRNDQHWLSPVKNLKFLEKAQVKIPATKTLVLILGLVPFSRDGIVRPKSKWRGDLYETDVHFLYYI